MQVATRGEGIPEAEIEYDLFISYSTDPDYSLSRKIESFLESFHRRIKSKGTALKPLSICRDGIDFSLHRLQKAATSSDEKEPVKSILVEYLTKSKYLLVFCSKNSARSDYVAFEIDWFLQNKGASYILLAVTEGTNIPDEKQSIFSPAILKYNLDTKPYYDLRGFKKESKDWKKIRDHEEELTNIAAFLNNDTTGRLMPLWRREETQKLKRQRYITGIAALIFLGLAVIAFFQRKEAVRQKRIVENQLAKSYWTNSQAERAENNILSALHFAAEALLKNSGEELKEDIMRDFQPFLPLVRLENIIPIDSFRAFSPDGSKALTIHNNTAHVSDLHNEKGIVSFRLPESLYGIIFSHDGKKIITESSRFKSVWDATSGKQIGDSFEAEGISLDEVLSPDGNYILTKNSDDTISVKRLSDGKKIRDFFHPFGYQRSPMLSDPEEYYDEPIASTMYGTLGIFSRDGKSVLTFRDETMRMWDIATGRQVRSFVNKELVSHAFFSECGTKLLSVTENTFCIWDVVSGKLVDCRGSDRINDRYNAVFNPSGDKILIPIDSSVHMWWPAFDTLRRNVKLYNILTTFVKANGEVSKALFSPDGKYFLSVNEKWVSIWDTESGEEITPALYHENLVTDAIFADGGRTILTATDKHIRKWEFGLHEVSTVTLDKGGMNHDAVFYKDQKQIIIARHTDLFTWDIEKKQQSLYKKGVIPDEVDDVTFNFDGTKACIIKDSIARIMDVQTGKELVSFNNHTNIFSIDFSRNGKYFLLQDFDTENAIRVYDLASGKQVGTTHNSSFDEQHIFPEFNPDATLIMIKSNRYILLWDFINNQITDSIYNEHDLMNSVGQRSNTGNFSSDGKLILTVSNNNVRIWDIQKKRLQVGFIHCNNFIDAAIFNSNNKHILTISRHVVRTWDIRTGKQIGVSKAINGNPDPACSPDGRYILLKGVSSIRLFDNGADLDLSPSLFALQIKVLTGVQFDANYNDLRCMSAKEWAALKEEFEKKGSAHYISCNYPSHNVWKRFHAAESNARPRL